ncbi:hypothetical protein VUR80DRAFT_6203 [Thermomyces stellatus]
MHPTATSILWEGSNPTPDGRPPGPGWMIIQYLSERVPIFRELTELQERGWENPEGDKFFKGQGNRGENSSEKTELFFYGLMEGTGRELHDKAGAFRVPGTSRPGIRDMCMATGDSSDTKSRDRCPGIHSAAVRWRTGYVTMLVADMGVSSIPHEHEEAGNFLRAAFDGKRESDIVLCDGQGLRTQSRAWYPSTSPKAGHAKRSSFYMVAKTIDKQAPNAVSAVKERKERWRAATFGTDAEYEKWLQTCRDALDVAAVLEDFGPKLIELWTPVWRVQAEALAKAPFVTAGRGE